MAKIYVVDLTEEERTFLLNLIKSGEHSARKINRARILLLADEDKKDREIAEASPTSVSTVQRTRQRFVEGNLERALNEDLRPGGHKNLHGKGKAVLLALSRSEPPASEEVNHATASRQAGRVEDCGQHLG